MNSTLRATLGLRNFLSNAINKETERSRPESPSTNDAPSIQTTLTDGSLNINSLTASGSPRLMAGRFKFISLLGKGTFAQTLRMEDQLHPHKQHVAVKVMNAFYSDIGEEEAKLLSKLNGADRSDNCHIVRLYTYFRFGHHFCLVFELLEHKKLSLRRLTQTPKRLNSTVIPAAGQLAYTVDGLDSLRKVAWQLLVSLMFLKDQGILHADLKPENILYRTDSNMHAKLIDFGNALSINDVAAYYQDFELQSLLYRAPEVLVGMPFGFPIDVWSVGMILCEFWIGRPLCAGENRQQMMESLLPILGPLPYGVYSAGKYFQQSFCTVTYNTFNLDLSDSTDHCKFRVGRLSEILQCRDMFFLQFINELLEYDPDRRLTPVNALRHPFLSTLFPFELFERSLAVDAVDMNEILMDAGAATPPRPPVIQPPSLAVAAIINDENSGGQSGGDIGKNLAAIDSAAGSSLFAVPELNPATPTGRSLLPSTQSSFQPCKRHSNEFNSLINYQSTKLVESDMMDFIETSPEVTMHSVAAQTDFHDEEELKYANGDCPFNTADAIMITGDRNRGGDEEEEGFLSNVEEQKSSTADDAYVSGAEYDDTLKEEKENSTIGGGNSSNSSSAASTGVSKPKVQPRTAKTILDGDKLNHTPSPGSFLPSFSSRKRLKQKHLDDGSATITNNSITDTPTSPPRTTELLQPNRNFKQVLRQSLTSRKKLLSTAASISSSSSSASSSSLSSPSAAAATTTTTTITTTTTTAIATTNAKQSARLERPTIIVRGRTRRQAAAIKQQTNQHDIVLDRDILLHRKRSMSPSEFL